MPRLARTTSSPQRSKPPTSVWNSPTNWARPGRPIDANSASVISPVYKGIWLPSPPNWVTSMVCVRS